jgi:carboxyl-terminal processing protease
MRLAYNGAGAVDSVFAPSPERSFDFMPPRNFNIILFAVATSILCHVTYRNARTASMVGEAIELVERYYVDPVDRQELLTAAMQGIVDELDEHSGYFAVDAYATFQDSMHQEFAGIGIYVDQPEAGQPVRVVTPLVGSPAIKAGILPNDLILSVDGVDVSSMELPEVSKRLKGLPGTTVSLVVRRGETTESISVQRATIELESIVGDHRDADNRWVYRLKSEPSVAYIRMKSFGEKTVDELAGVLKRLDNDFTALVLDLRGNGGGLLYAARDVCDMFLSSGKIVSTRIRGGAIDESYSATEGTLVDPDIPMAVLIDRDSASASEIVAACLQDNRRAIVAGTRSYGKGTVQEIIPLQYGRNALRLTVAKYYRPNNHNIHRDADATEQDEWGVTPDPGFVVPMDEEALIQLAIRWREASFPLLAGIETTSLESVPRTSPEVQRFESPSQPTDDSPETAPVVPGEEPPAIAVAGRDAPGDVELSEPARQNVEAGPQSLAEDPPLRAAVGYLLRSADRSDGGG